MLGFAVHRQTTLGPAAQFACPRCGQPTTSGRSHELAETFLLLYVLPLFVMRNTYVTCDHCGATLTTRLRLADLEQQSWTDISPFLSHHVSLVLKFLTLVSLLLWWMPFVGSVIPAIVLVATRRSPGLPRTLAIISLALSFIPVLLLGLLFVLHLLIKPGP
jgi:hypothetical protein